MKKRDIVERLAKQARLSKAAAADRVDGVVHEILTHLKQGQTALLPGLGTLKPADGTIRFEPPEDSHASSTRRRR
jgi:nucleoid DNA-binding protein